MQETQAWDSLHKLLADLQRGDGREDSAEIEQILKSLHAPQANAMHAQTVATRSSPPPFYWVPSVETILEFEVNGAHGELVTKIGDFEDDGWVLPIAGTLRMKPGGLYRWTLQLVHQCPHRPQMQFGVHGIGHAQPWRVVSSERCSRSKDDEPWKDRPGGDLVITEGDYIHCETDLRVLGSRRFGTFAFAVNDGPFETAFEDLPLLENPLVPVVSMGGAGTTCRLCPL